MRKEHKNVQHKNSYGVLMNYSWWIKKIFNAEINGNIANSCVDFGSQCHIVNEFGVKLNVVRGVGGGMAHTFGVFEATLRVD